MMDILEQMKDFYIEALENDDRFEDKTLLQDKKLLDEAWEITIQDLKGNCYRDTTSDYILYVLHSSLIALRRIH